MREIKEHEGKSIIDNLLKEQKVSLKDLSFSIENEERICVGCGCSDNRACCSGCWWIDTDETSIFGICSNCEDEIEKYNDFEEDPLMVKVEKILNILNSYHFSIHDEKYLQEEISQVFKEENIEFKKEHKLSNGIIDFMIDDIGLEVKIKGQNMAIYRQIERYMENDSIKAIILANVKPMTLPEVINDKKAFSVTLRGSY